MSEEVLSAQIGIREDFKNVVDDLMSSCETKIDNINNMFETAHFIFSELQQPLLELKDQKENIKGQLRDLLAKNEHLRRCDFNQMIQGVVLVQEEKEKEVRNLLNDYVREQRRTINLLRENLAKIKEALARGEGVCLGESQEMMSDTILQQDKKKQEVTLKLKEFQNGQIKMTKKLLGLLAKGKELRISDFKLMLEEFKSHKEERQAINKKRKEEVAKMLRDFREKRKHAVLAPKAVNIDTEEK